MKKATHSEEQGSQSHLHDTSSHAQRARMLERLHTGPVDTITARSELNILHPAARVQELRDRGHNIRTHRISLTDDLGRTHHGIALYYIGTLTEAGQEVA